MPRSKGFKRLEREPQSKLNQSGVVVGGFDLAELGAAKCRVGGSELDPVEDVEEFGAEFHVEFVVRTKVGLLECREVKVIDTVLPQRGIRTGLSAEGVGSRADEAAGVEPFDNGARATLGASCHHVWPNGARAQAQVGQGVRGAIGYFQREAALERGDAVNAPAGHDLIDHAGGIAHEPLAVAKRQVQHVADDEALGNVLRGERILTPQIVPILHVADAAVAAALQPRGDGVRVRNELGVSVRHKERATAIEALRRGELERVVAASAAANASQLHVAILREGAVQLPLNQTAISQAAGQVHGERVSGGLLGNRHGTCAAGSELLRGLSDEAVGNLIDVDALIRGFGQVYTVRTGIRDVQEHTPRQLSLDVQVPLLNVARARLGKAVRGQRRLLQTKGRDIWQGIPTHRSGNRRTKRSRLRASKDIAGAGGGSSGPTCTSERAATGVERARRIQPLCGAGKEAGSCAVYGVGIGVELEDHIVRDEEDAVARPDDRLRVQGVGHTEPRREFVLGQGLPATPLQPVTLAFVTLGLKYVMRLKRSENGPASS